MINPSVETLYLASLRDEEKVQTTNIIMVVKTIVVRNLFSFEYDGSNPSLPTKKFIEVSRFSEVAISKILKYF